jgi:methylmalonyl-CoA/ethylmalonyl-CoA epimerase
MSSSLIARYPVARAGLAKAAKFLNGVAKTYGLLDDEAAPSSPAASPAQASASTASVAAREGFTINHVGMAVPNIDQFLAANDVLYRNFRKTSAVVNDRQHVREVFISDGKTVIELLEPTGEGSPLNGFLRKNRAGGLIHVCFDCDEINTAIAAIKAAGGVVITGPIPDIAFDERPIAFMMLADQVIELVQRPT